MPRNCSYPQCAHRRPIRDKTAPDCKMHVFPANRQVCQNWLDACHFKVSPTNIPAALYICSCHFEGGRGPTAKNPNPFLYKPSNEAESANLQKRFQPNAQCALWKHGNVERMDISINPFQKFFDEINLDDPVPLEKSFSNVVNEQNNQLVCTQSQQFILPRGAEKSSEVAQLSSAQNLNLSSFQQNTTKSFGVDLAVENSRKVFLAIPLRLTQPAVEVPINKAIPLSSKEEVLQQFKKRKSGEKNNEDGPPTRYIGVQCNFPAFSYENCLRTVSDSDFDYMTGVTSTAFDLLYEYLGGDEVCSQLSYRYDNDTPVEEIDISHSRKGHLFMTLMRLRRGYALRDMSLFFNLKRSQISAIFFTWVKFLASKFQSSEKFMFISVANQQKLKPDCYKEFPKLRCVIGTIDIKIQNSTDVRQSEFISDGCDSVKFLVATSVLGGLSFISAGIDGSDSDRKLFMKSGILEYLSPGEAVLADRSYGMESHLKDLNVDLITPSVRAERKTSTSKEVMISKAIATSQTFLTEMRKFKFIRYVVPCTVLELLPDIVRICACLYNFRDPFTKWHLSDASNT